MPLQRDLQENVPFLSSNHCETPQLPDFERGRLSSKARYRFRLGALGVLLVLSNAIWAFKQWTSSTECVRPQMIFSSAVPAIQYQRKTLWRRLENNAFTGPPRPEFETAWHQLLDPFTIRITQDELARIGGASIALADGSGYVAELAAFHELHCVKRIRQHLYLDHYYPNMTAEEREVEDTHIDHCLEYWREAAMCRGDPTLATFLYEDGFPKSRVSSEHECIDWDAMMAWAQARKIDVSDRRVLTPL